MTPNEQIRPLHDVWLRPRRVFRELAERPVGLTDQMLGAAQGITNALGACRALDLGNKMTLTQILSGAALFGGIAGIVSLYLMAAVYARLAKRASPPPTRPQVVHVLAYSSVPIAVALGIWVVTALLAGEVSFVQTPREVDGFVTLLLDAQLAGYALLVVWTVILQVMGFSEIMGAPLGKAFGVWVLGQLIVALAILCLNLLTTALLPSS